MGVVVEATHMQLGQRVAVKMLHENAARDSRAVARFLREARIAAQLPSEHVARVHDFSQTETGQPYLVMELLTGPDLAAELEERGALGLAEAVDYTLQACCGVAEAHARGLVHRDLKPGNLFLAERPDGPPTLKVLDFGISKVLAAVAPALTTTAASMGTPGYMSPEQILSPKLVDSKTDQHALAAILYEMLTGKLPYSADSLPGLAVAIATTPPPSPRRLRPEIPIALDAAIVRALAKKPQQRFESLATFATAIAPCGTSASGALARRIGEILKEPARLQGTGSVAERVPESLEAPPEATVLGDFDPLSTTLRAGHPEETDAGGRPRHPGGRGAKVVAIAAVALALVGLTWLLRGRAREGLDQEVAVADTLPRASEVSPPQPEPEPSAIPGSDGEPTPLPSGTDHARAARPPAKLPRAPVALSKPVASQRPAGSTAAPPTAGRTGSPLDTVLDTHH